MLATKKYIYDKLKADTALVAIIGTAADHIRDSWPETFTVWPLVIYQDDNQGDWHYTDNKPTGSSVRYRIDIFTKNDGIMPTTTSIGIAVANIFSGLYFNCGTNGEVSDVVEGARHRVMRFSRELFPSDIK
jgi:hypothetical protein